MVGEKRKKKPYFGFGAMLATPRSCSKGDCGTKTGAAGCLLASEFETVPGCGFGGVLWCLEGHFAACNKHRYMLSV